MRNLESVRRLAMKDMRLTKKQSKRELMPSDAQMPEYPWGLQIRLDTEGLAKLGLNKLPAVGEKFTIVAQASVTEVSQRENLRGKDERCVELQIERLALEPKAKKEAA